jgi:hypothetical protein
MQLEAELSSMVPDENASIEECLTKFRLLVTRLKGCGKSKLDEKCIFLILSKLKCPYHIFSSSFYSTMDALGCEFKVTSFDLFCERLTREKFNYITQLDSLFSSNNKALMAYTSKTKKKKYSAQAGESTSKPQQKNKNIFLHPILVIFPSRKGRRSQVTSAAYVADSGMLNPNAG